MANERLSGVLATITIRLDPSPPPFSPRSGRLRGLETDPGFGDAYNNLQLQIASWAVGDRDRISTELRRALHQRLPQSIYVEPITVRQGSVEIVAAIAAVGLAIKSYSEFVKSLDESVEITRKWVSQTISQAEMDAMVTSSWTAGPAVQTWIEASDASLNEVAPYAGPQVALRANNRLMLMRILLPYVVVLALTAIALVALMRMT